MDVLGRLLCTSHDTYEPIPVNEASIPFNKKLDEYWGSRKNNIKQKKTCLIVAWEAFKISVYIFLIILWPKGRESSRWEWGFYNHLS